MLNAVQIATRWPFGMYERNGGSLAQSSFCGASRACTACFHQSIASNSSTLETEETLTRIVHFQDVSTFKSWTCRLLKMEASRTNYLFWTTPLSKSEVLHKGLVFNNAFTSKSEFWQSSLRILQRQKSHTRAPFIGTCKKKRERERGKGHKLNK